MMSQIALKKEYKIKKYPSAKRLQSEKSCELEATPRRLIIAKELLHRE